VRYIKLFENWTWLNKSNWYSIQSDVIDIFQDMKDDHQGSKDLFISVRLLKKPISGNSLIIEFGDEYHDTDMTFIDTSQYKEDFLRLNDYLLEKGFEFNYFCWDDNISSSPIVFNRESVDKLFSIKPTNYIKIYYKHLDVSENFKLTDISNIMLDLRDLCYELDDEGINWTVYPDTEIRKNILSFQLRDLLDKNRSDKVQFYLEIDVNNKLTDTSKRSGMFDSPEWFIDFLKRIEDSMSYYNFKTIVSVRLPGDREYLENIEELSEYKGLVWSIKLEFELL